VQYNSNPASPDSSVIIDTDNLFFDNQVSQNESEQENPVPHFFNQVFNQVEGSETSFQINDSPTEVNKFIILLQKIVTNSSLS